MPAMLETTSFKVLCFLIMLNIIQEALYIDRRNSKQGEEEQRVCFSPTYNTLS